MKTKWKVLFALLAALALVFAAGCSDGSDDAWEDAGSTGAESSGSTDGSALPEITADEVQELFRSIGELIGNVDDKDRYEIGNCYWNFPEGTLDVDGEEGCTFTVEWVDMNTDTKIKPQQTVTLSNIKELGEISTDRISVDLSESEWINMPGKVVDGETVIVGTIKTSIELTPAASSYTIPERLQSVTLMLDSSVKQWLYN